MTLEEWQRAYPFLVSKSTGVGLGDYEDSYRKFSEMYGKSNPYAGGSSNNTSAQLWEQGNDAAAQQAVTNEADQAAYGQEMSGAWGKYLTPEQLKEYYSQKEAKYKKEQKMGQMAFLAAAGAMAAPGILGAMGSAGGSGTGALGAAGGDLGMAGWMGTGAGPMGVEAGAAGLAGGGGAMSGLGAAGGDLGMASWFPEVSQMGGSGWMDYLKQYGPDIAKLFTQGQGGGSQQQQGGGALSGIGNLLGTGGLGLLSQYYNNSKMPGVPDFMKLAQMTGASANPNQINAQGDSLNWAIDPATGQRTQTVKYGASNQKAFDEQQAMAQALRSKVMNRPAAGPMQQVDLSNLWG